MDIQNREGFIKASMHNNRLMNLKNLFFNAEKQMDTRVFFDFLQDQKTQSTKSWCTPKRLMQYYDEFGNNLLHISEILDKKSLSYWLIDTAPELMQQTNQWGQYPAHFACLHDLGMQKYPPDLLRRCACKRQQNLLHISAAVGTANNVKWFLESADLINNKHSFDSLPLHCALNMCNPEPHVRLKKISTVKIMLRHLGHRKARWQLQQKNAFDMTPQDWIDSTLSGAEVDFLWQL